MDNLELAGLDSATRAQLSTPHQRLQRGVLVTDSAPVLVPQLVGVTRSDGTRRPDLRWRLYADQSLVESCPDECFDHAPSVHTITHFAKEGFYGAWGNAMTGNTMLVDPKTGRALPAPAGYFCAIKRRDA